MKCPVCGTDGVEGGVCFYCEARRRRAEDRSEASDAPSESESAANGDPTRKLVVLGAGLAGLAAASGISRSGWDATVVEAAPHVGGLAASFTLDTEWGEFDYDNGPHRFHTNEEELISEVRRLLGDNVCLANRLSRIFLYNRFFDYPLKGGNVVRSLPKLVLVKAFADYMWVKFRSLFHRRPDDNFENWVVNRFGRKLFVVYDRANTEKTWGIPCNQISADWAAQRISLLSLWDTVKKTFFRPKNVPRTYVSEFIYPRRGGIGEVTRAYKRELEEVGMEVLTSCPATAIHVSDGRVTGVDLKTPDGPRHLETNRVLSTIPVTVLCRLITPSVPQEVLDSVAALKHRSMIFVHLILDRPKLTDDHWIYLPEQKLITHRLSEFKNFSPDAAPKDKTLICAEITCDYGDEDWQRSDDELRGIVVKDLAKIGLLREDEVLHTFSRRERYAYPIYDLTYAENRDRIQACLDAIEGLETTGRQGLFKYNNMDHSIAMGLGAAENLMGVGEDHRKVASGQQYFG